MHKKKMLRFFSLFSLVVLSLFIIVESCLPGDVSSLHSWSILSIFEGKKTLEMIEPEAISGIGYEGTLLVNRPKQLSPVFFPENTTDKRVIWSVSEGKATIASNGELLVLEEGKTIIRATSVAKPAIHKEIEIVADEVGIEEMAISIQEERPLLIGSTLSLKVSLNPSDATYVAVTYFSSRPDVAEISSDGIIKGRTAGTTEVYARNMVGLPIESNRIRIDVMNEIAKPVTMMSIEKNIMIHDSDSKAIIPSFNDEATDHSFHFENIDNDLIEVRDHRLYGKKPGGTEVKVLSNSNPEIFEIIQVEVLPVLAKSVHISSGSSIELGKIVQLSFSMVPEIAGLKVTNQSVSWESMNPNMATIDRDGKILGMKTGKVEIKVKWAEDPSVEATSSIIISTMSQGAYSRVMKLLRKLLGHFSLFLMAGFFAFLCFSGFSKKRPWYFVFIISLIYGILLAGLSEFLQLFPQGRTPSFKDVGIDLLGFISGMFIVYLACAISKVNDIAAKEALDLK